MAVAPAPLEPAQQVTAPATSPALPSSVYIAPQNPAAESDVPIPAPVALPADSTTSGQSSSTRRFYTLTASLREVYDDNVNTSENDPKTSLDSILTPSILVDFPDADGDFSARYSLGLTHYTSSPNDNGTSSSGSGAELQITHELVAQYTHAFSDRFQLSASEDFRYFTEPSILQSTGTSYQSGPYYSNIISGNSQLQWTPLFGTTVNYSNTVVHYVDSTVGTNQNSIENVGGPNFTYAVLPKVLATVGAIIDNTTYQQSNQGFSGYTLDGGGIWQVLPSISILAQGGIIFINERTPFGSIDSTAPYAAANLNWSFGARSSLKLTYAHEVTPGNEVGGNAQVSDQFNATFSYLITPRLTAHLDGVYTAATNSSLATSGSASSDQANVYEVDTGLAYQYTSYLSFSAGIIASGVSANQADQNLGNNSYTRDEAYVGVRGTY